MYTQCPFCHSAYAPTPSQLAQARGRLHCVVCEREFDALDRLGDAPIAGQRARPAHLPGGSAPIEQGDLFASQDEPGFVRPRVRPPTRWHWWAGSALLLATLLAQIVLADRLRLVERPGWRAPIERLSDAFGLGLPALRDPARLRLLARDVRPHPSVPDALLVSASFRNDAAHPQAWPILELALADIDGKPIALRRFQVEEYLGVPPQKSTLDPGQSVSATLELLDPGRDAIAFAFEFR